MKKSENARGIYKIVNTLNGKCYVGSTTVAFKKRWSTHSKTLAEGRHHSWKLQQDYADYGNDAFVFLIIEVVQEESKLLTREQFWIDKLNCVESGYNVAPFAMSSLGVKWTPDSRQKMAAIRMANPISADQHALMAEGRRNSPVWRAAMAKVHQGNIGRRQSAEAKAAIGEVSRNQWLDPKRKANHSAKMTGYKHTEEAREKISKGRTGMAFTEMHMHNLSVAHLGYEPTVEARKNMSLGQQRRRERERVERDALSSGSKLPTEK